MAEIQLLRSVVASEAVTADAVDARIGAESSATATNELILFLDATKRGYKGWVVYVTRASSPLLRKRELGELYWHRPLPGYLAHQSY